MGMSFFLSSVMMVNMHPSFTENDFGPSHVLPSAPLSAEAFSPYGQVLNLNAPANRTINQGTSGRLDLHAGLNLTQQQGQAVLAVFHAIAQKPQGPCQMLERHQWGSQTFIPLSGARSRLLVALGKDKPDWRTLACFDATGQQGYTLHPGTWHHPLLAMDNGSFLVLERQGLTEDCETHPLPFALYLPAL
jgi:ureidoglycolate lyase